MKKWTSVLILHDIFVVQLSQKIQSCVFLFLFAGYWWQRNAKQCSKSFLVPVFLVVCLLFLLVILVAFAEFLVLPADFGSFCLRFLLVVLDHALVLVPLLSLGAVVMGAMVMSGVVHSWWPAFFQISYSIAGGMFEEYGPHIFHLKQDCYS